MKTACRGRILTTILALAAFTPGAWGANRLPADGRLGFEAGVENFRWQEFGDGGDRLLTEQGPRLLLYALVDNRYRDKPGVLYSARLGGFAGNVDYDGQDSNAVFVSTNTSYQGWNGELTGGYRSFTGDGGYAVDLIGSVGADLWRRNLDNSINANGQPVSGYREEYRVGYARLGVGLARWHGGGMSYMQLGFKYPFSIDEDVEVSGQDVTLSPGEEWSGFASYKITFDNSNGAPGSNYVMFYYDSYRLDSSPSKSVSSGSIRQPTSNMDRFGVMIGYAY